MKNNQGGKQDENLQQILHDLKRMKNLNNQYQRTTSTNRTNSRPRQQQQPTATYHPNAALLASSINPMA
jgi:hypothetical protein